MQTFLATIPFFFRFVVNGIGFAGIIFILYEIGLMINPLYKYAPLERCGDFVAAILTVLGTALAALSIYFESDKPHPPEPFSKWLTAPALLLMCLCALVLIVRGRKLSSTALNGFAMIGLAAALLRLQPNPYLH